MDVAAAHLLDFSKAFDCSLMDQIVAIWSDGASPQRPNADAFLQRLRDNPDMWKRVDAILEGCKNDHSKFFILMVLRNTIDTRWKVIPIDDREGLRNYIVGKILAMSASDELMHVNNQIISQLNQTLVAILKQDWPQNWPTFIGDIVGSSKTSESLCENNMRILKLLSEDVFVFSAESMTAAKIKQMKESLNEEFSQVFQLCLLVMEASQKPSLLHSCLDTLQRFLTWIPLGYIFETNLLSELLKFFQAPAYRTVTLECLTEIASIPAEGIHDNYKPRLMELFVHVVSHLVTMVGDTNLTALYENGSEEDCLFLDRLALFLGTFMRSFLHFFDRPDGTIEHCDAVLAALKLLLRISNIDNEDVFKTCLEFWSHFAKEMFTKGQKAASALGSSRVGAFGMGIGGSVFMGQASAGGVFQPLGHDPPERLPPIVTVAQHQIYAEVLHHLRITMIDHMAKPEEVIVVEDDNGEIVREQTKDTEVIAQYKTMREAIVHLTHLNSEDTENIMCEKLEYQVANNGVHFTWSGLNTLCWAIGSISGAMSDIEEKRFLVAVIRDLLKLCEEQRGKDNKAVVASNIMYIVGQYPRFLRAHWKFLKTVVNKLFEFMHEHHPGVQDMACDTFLKIAQQCKRKFMTPQTEEEIPFIVVLIRDIRRHTADLHTHQVLSFYESVGTMLSDQAPQIVLQRDQVIMLLMEVANESWRRIMLGGQQDTSFLLQEDTMKELKTVLRINNRICLSAGCIYAHQLSAIFLDMLGLYRFYGEQLRAACASKGEICVQYKQEKAMRGIKSDILELLSSFWEVAKLLDGGPQVAMPLFLPQLMEDILADYRAGPPAARDAKVLTLFCSVVSVLKEHVAVQVPRIMDAIMMPTLEMITTNMLDNPDHRIGFFRFLREANEHCFYGLFGISHEHVKLIIDSIVWAFKHTERNIAETGLETLNELLENIVKAQDPQFAQTFYSSFLLMLIQEVLGVLTDRLHKCGFKMQATVLRHLFHLVQNGLVLVPLYDPAAMPPTVTNNAQFLNAHVCDLLVKAFPNLSTALTAAFVNGLFDTGSALTSKEELNVYKQHLRDFLVAYNVHENEDSSLYFEEEMMMQQKQREEELRHYQESIPGMLKPSELAEIGEDI